MTSQESPHFEWHSGLPILHTPDYAIEHMVSPANKFCLQTVD
jgi:hypothetical protein